MLVATGITLTIEPGVQVKFGENIGLVVNGKIVAVGTTSSRILFTSNKETPQKGDWASIKLTSSATGSTWDTNFNFLSGSKFENCDFSYAGNSAIISEVPLFIEKSLFSKNKNWGEYRKGVFQQGNQYYYAGGALSLKGGVSVIKSTLFFDNESDNGYSHGFGGAIYSQSGGNIIGCVFINNTAIGNGEGGGVYAVGGNVSIEKSTFINNKGFFRGNAIGVSSSVSINTSIFYSSNQTGNGLISNDGNSSQIVLNNSNILASENYIIKNGNSNTIDARFNYWSPVHINSISGKIYDFNNSSSLGLVNYSSNSTGIVSSAPLTTPINVTKSIVNNSVVLSWANNNESDISGYKIYYGDYTGYSFSTVIDAENVTSYTLPAGVSLNDPIAVTAYDTSKDG
ncbi:MAG: hypothetical protein LW824_17855, partial [Algoriphagus sp.]|nr:hypothetical protein [Algoriphagus sp.]